MVHIRQLNKLSLMSNEVQTLTLKKGAKFHDAYIDGDSEYILNLYHAARSGDEDVQRKFVVVDPYTSTPPEHYVKLQAVLFPDGRRLDLYTELIYTDEDTYPYVRPEGEYEFPNCRFEVFDRSFDQRMEIPLISGELSSAAAVISLLSNYSTLSEVVQGNFLTELQRLGSAETDKNSWSKDDVSVKVRTIL